MTQTKESNDIVLKSARGILTFSKWALLVGISVVVLCLLAIPFTYQFLLAEMSKAFVNPPEPEMFGMIALIMILAIVMLLLTLFAVDRLRRIVNSVGEGNPFTHINGTRLRGIGIAAFAIQIVTFCASLLAIGVVTMLGDPKPGVDFEMPADASISVSGVLLVLLLIILARVFDRGAEMQEELEGTV
ncbi:DUF2975 domain-containing protein [Parasphingorhabdus halotolerans]|uniref:DUF2975 domain-containing protein n=1 Tax=Parasphingorhabdus halotolerans TaxID=2725558 RepID=A0A6H2DPG5_9SPHN|nr:DUF2975 domain-containing protein [Parasphingorhabdus halotolerans]QJB70088.1 DUF2975 domain-containing protein [Parasphingorhabdus halotolerans]